MVLSHHGQLEFGSPKIPIFPEALLLHYLDDMDSKMECMRVQIDRDPQAEGYFSAYSPSLGRVALRKKRYLESSNEAGAPETAVPLNNEPKFIPAEILNNNDHSSHNSPSHNSSLHSAFDSPASNSSNSMYPGRSPVPAPPNYKPASAANSIFGAKLQQALHDERK